jgi:hypothetical protein
MKCLCYGIAAGEWVGGMEEKAGLWKRSDGIRRSFTVATGAGDY